MQQMGELVNNYHLSKEEKPHRHAREARVPRGGESTNQNEEHEGGGGEDYKGVYH